MNEMEICDNIELSINVILSRLPLASFECLIFSSNEDVII